MEDKNHKVLSEKYFEYFSEKNVEALSKLYSDTIILTDWNGKWNGKENVLDENKKLFERDFTLEIRDIGQIGNKTYTFLNITVEGDTIRVLDILEWDANYQIKSVEAYWR
jgi:hypothetical protein